MYVWAIDVSHETSAGVSSAEKMDVDQSADTLDKYDLFTLPESS